MRFFAGLLAAMLLLAGADKGHGTVRIVCDPGGPIRPYVDRYDHLRASGQNVIIDGLCASVCTIVLGKISHDKICVTSQAKLAFHAAWDFGARGLSITNRQATQMLYSMYPSPIRQWIDSRGGLRTRAIFLQGKQLNAMYRLCQVNGQRKLNA